MASASNRIDLLKNNISEWKAKKLQNVEEWGNFFSNIFYIILFSATINHLETKIVMFVSNTEFFVVQKSSNIFTLFECNWSFVGS